MRRIAPFVMMFLLAGGVASAQPKAEGTRLFEQGRDLAKAGKYAEACEAFGKSISIDRAAGTALNYGDCLEHLGQLRKAWQMYDEAAREFDKQADARGKFARERAAAVIPKLGTLRVKLAEPSLSGLVVKIGGESLPPQRELVERLEPGTVEVTASAPGRAAFSSSARMVAGASVSVEIPVLATAEGSAPNHAIVTDRTGHRDQPDLTVRPKRPDRPEPASRTRRSPGRVRLSLGFGIAAGSVLTVGAVMALAAKGKYSNTIDGGDCATLSGQLICNADGAAEIQVAGRRADIATGCVIGGGALAVVAAVLFVTAPREGITMTPMASATSVGLGFGRSF